MARGVWSSKLSSFHIDFLKVETCFLTSTRFQKWLCGTHILVQMDSTTVMHYLNSAAGTRSRSLDLKVCRADAGQNFLNVQGFPNVQSSKAECKTRENNALWGHHGRITMT